MIKGNSDPIATLITIGIVVILGFVIYAGWGQLMYGDWTCGFKTCVQVAEAR